MKSIRRYITLAAIILALPAFGDDKPQPLNLSADPETMLLQIDLKVRLQQYEKLRTEAGEAELQLALGQVETPDPSVVEAQKALAYFEDKEKTNSATNEELKAAKIRYEQAEERSFERLKRRYQVLKDMAERARAEARLLATELAKRTNGGALEHPQAEPKPCTPQS